MHRCKVGDIVQVLNINDSRYLHNAMPDIYPKPYTMGIVLDTDNSKCTHLRLRYLGFNDSLHTWWHLGSCIRYVPYKELQTMSRYYELYQKSACFSVRDFYDKVSTAKKVAEDAIKYKMELCKGGDYKVLCGNSQSFTVAFVMFNLLYVITPHREYIIDIRFIQQYLENNKK